jgi:hypothetical protein
LIGAGAIVLGIGALVRVYTMYQKFKTGDWESADDTDEGGDSSDDPGRTDDTDDDDGTTDQRNR